MTKTLLFLLAGAVMLCACELEGPSGPRPSPSPSSPSGPAATASAPSGVTAMALSESSLLLAWTASTDDVGVSHYKLYRGGEGFVGTTSQTQVRETGLAAEREYCYRVSAVDAAGNESPAAEW